jgi:hypothetical protein
MPDPNELTPQNAPRDAALLAQYTPYQLRCLAEKYLAGIRDEKEKMGWFQLRTNEARAAYILELLKRYDGTTNGAAHTNGVSAPSISAQAPAARAPVTSAPSVQSMAPVAAPGTAAPPVGPTVNMPPSVAPTTGPAPFIPQVAPAAVAAAGAAAGEKAKRAPRTTAAPAAELPADLGATIVNLLNRLLEGQDKASKGYEDMVRQVSNILEEAAAMKSSRVETLEGHYAALTTKMETLDNLVQSSWKVQTWLLMMLLQSQANANNADIVDVLRMAISDGDSFQTILAQARGKA